eukprot:gene33072-40006_t
MPINYKFQFYRVLLILAGNELSAQNKDMQLRLPELKTQIKVKFFEWLEHLRNDHEAFQRSGLHLPPDLTVDVLKSYVLDKHDTSFWRDFCESKRYIILYMNPLWKTLEGVKDMDELQLQMRQILWKKRERDLIKKRTRTLETRPFDNSWYPDEWFCFLFFGLPTGEENCVPILREDKGAGRIKAIDLESEDSSDDGDQHDFLNLGGAVAGGDGGGRPGKKARGSDHILLPNTHLSASVPLVNMGGPGSGVAAGLPRTNVGQTLNMLASSALSGTAGANVLSHLATALEQQTKVLEFESKKQALERLVDLYAHEGNVELADQARGKLRDLLAVHMN